MPFRSELMASCSKSTRLIPIAMMTLSATFEMLEWWRGGVVWSAACKVWHAERARA